MPLLAIRCLDLAFGGPKLLDEACLTVEPRERICLIGRNGEGKSSLLKVLNGDLQADRIEWETAAGLRVAMMQQDIPAGLDNRTVFDVVAEGAGAEADQLRRYHETSARLGQEGADMDSLLAEMDRLQAAIDSVDGWKLETRTEALVSRVGLVPDQLFGELSGGLKRRAILARALVSDPQLLLLDEPTNHLDLEAIDWLEQFLLRLNCAVLFITHDRTFLRRLATRIIELDRGHLASFDCDYATYLERKQVALEAESTRNAAFDKKLAQEEAWIRKGIQARRTRNEGRVRALEKLREERQQRRELRDGPGFTLHAGESSGQKVIECRNLSFSWGARTIVRDFSTVINRGDKIGIVGPNGSGKTTLIQLLLGQLQPNAGWVKLGTNVQVAFAEQNRDSLQLGKTVAWNVAGESDSVHVGGRKRPILGYLQDFLFTPDRARSTAGMLSGGERNRLLLARLFTREANVLVMDEPTNDLDLETLELLEEILVEFTGTLLLTSHDREFLNRVVTSTIAIEPNGRIVETVGGYDDYKARVSAGKKGANTGGQNPATVDSGARKRSRERKNGPTNRQRRELEEVEAEIERLERRQTEITEAMSNVACGVSSGFDPKTAAGELESIQTALESALARWETLAEQF